MSLPRSTIASPAHTPHGVSLLPRSSSSAFSTPTSTGASTPTASRLAAVNASNTMSPRRAPSSLAASQRRSAHQSSTAAAMAGTDANSAVSSLFGFYSHSGVLVNDASSRDRQRNSNGYNGGSQRISNGAGFTPQESRRVSFGSGVTASPRMAGSALPAYINQTRSFSPWDQSGSRAPYQLANQQDAANSSLQQPLAFEENTLNSFSWTIRDVHLLRDEVENTPPPSMGGRSVSAGAGKSDVWTTQPVFGEGNWRLELVRTRRQLKGSDAYGDVDGDGDGDAAPPMTEGTAELGDSESQPSASQGGGPDAEAGDNAELGADAPPSRSDSITVLSVYLTSLVLDYGRTDIEIPTSIMVGIRPAREAIGSRGSASGGWRWRQFYRFSFRREHEFFQCHDLPSVSELLEDPTIRSDDAFTLTIQLSRGPALAFQIDLGEPASFMPPFETEGAHLVPRSVLDALQGLMDDANTGDVRVVVRERGLLDTDSDISGLVLPYPVGASIRDAEGCESWQSTEKVCVRDRVLWAHSSILKHRSDYFHTMLASSFSEGMEQDYHDDPFQRPGAVEAVGLGGRQVRTLRIPDADFVTAYWFLRYLYTEEIQFAESEDVRSAALDDEWAMGADLAGKPASGNWPDSAAARVTPGQRYLWEWTPLSDLLQSQEEANHAHQRQQPPPPQSLPGQSRYSEKLASPGSPYSSFASTFPRTQHTTAHRTLHTRASDGVLTSSSRCGGPVEAMPPSPSLQQPSHSHSHSQPQPQPPQHAQTGPSLGSGSGNAASSSATSSPTSDPHIHPTDPPGRASALSIFKLAHRYNMSELSGLASAHLVASLTPTSAFPLLLATSVYADLHDKVKRYVYAHWENVANSDEFERCCDEVSAGEWGPEAGKAVRLFMKSLVSPARVVPVQSSRS
ncbi:hypothetical protein ACQY0O_003372 [Thecaphora frezii]